MFNECLYIYVIKTNSLFLINFLINFSLFFYVSNRVNFQTDYFANKLVFEAVQKTHSTCFIALKHPAIASCFKLDKTLRLVF